MENKFIRADDVAQELSVSKPYAYKLIRWSVYGLSKVKVHQMERLRFSHSSMQSNKTSAAPLSTTDYHYYTKSG